MKIFFIFGLFLSSLSIAKGLSFAKQRTEILSFFDLYLDGYNVYLNDINNSQALDDSSMVLHVPSIQVPPSGPMHLFESRKRITKGTQLFLDEILNEGVIKVEWEQLEIKVLNDQAAIVSAVANLIKTDRTIHRKSAATLVLYKSDEYGWQIVTRVLHSPEKSIKFYENVFESQKHILW